MQDFTQNFTQNAIQNASRYFASPPPPFHFGAGALERLGPEAATLARGGRATLIADPWLLDAGALAPALDGLARAGIDAVVFADFEGEPKLAHLRAAIDAARGAGLVIGVGGGSALDIAKIAAVCAAGAEAAARDPLRYALAAHPLPARRAALLLVPSTAGTGAEASSTSVFAGEAGRKAWLWGAESKPDLVLLDPGLTVSLPPDLTAWCGMDALVHAFEAVTNRNAHAGAALYGLAALRLISGALARAVAAPGDLAARSDMLLGSFYAGVAIDNCGVAIAHNVSHALAGLAPVHHGLATALGFEATLPWLVAGRGPGMEAAARACGLGAARDLPGWATGLMDRCAIARALPGAFAQVSAAAIAAEMAAPENAPMLKATIRPVGAAEIAEIAAAMRALAPAPPHEAGS